MKNKAFITGYAKLPQGITASELYKVICVGLLVDKETSVIEEAECSLVTKLANRVFSELVVGKTLLDIEEIEEAFANCYYGSAKKALISALKTCYEKYNQI